MGKREARKGSGDMIPGNSHSRPASGAPCDSRRSALLLRPLGAQGFGPSGGSGRQPKGSPYEKNVVSEQAAKQPTIETGLSADADFNRIQQKPSCPQPLDRRVFYAVSRFSIVAFPVYPVRSRFAP